MKKPTEIRIRELNATLINAIEFAQKKLGKATMTKTVEALIISYPQMLSHIDEQNKKIRLLSAKVDAFEQKVHSLKEAVGDSIEQADEYKKRLTLLSKSLKV